MMNFLEHFIVESFKATYRLGSTSKNRLETAPGVYFCVRLS